MKRLPFLLLLALVSCGAPASSPGAGLPPPNILWISVEDMSCTLGCWGDAYARTPAIDRLAAQSVRYTRAFASAPVCSPARSCLITGLYASSLGTQRLRSEFPIPDSVRGFPSYLRAAGYYTSNNVKTDYNSREESRLIAESWNESSPKAHWRGRPAGKPFFAVFNDMTTHQSRMGVWPYEQFRQEVQSHLAPSEIHDPAKAPVPPYYPDTPVVRRTLARAYDCISVMDQNSGRILRELEEDGLAEDTIVFFFSDHGAGLPRHKRLLYDSGLQVPLLIRFPEKYRAFAPAPPGSTVGRLVSFVDFAPTVLALAGIPRPAVMQGQVFLGSAAAAPRTHVYGARDRVDEAYDLSRSVRDDRWLYIRNFMPQRSANQPSAYSDQAEIRREITRLAAEGKLEGPALAYGGPRRPLEELYDSELDPFQVRNLAGDSAQAGRLAYLRGRMAAWIEDSGDVGFLPESEAWTRAAGGPLLGASIPRGRLLAAAGLVGTRRVPEMLSALADGDASVRAWGAIALGAMQPLPPEGRAPLEKALADPSAAVRIEAAGALGSVAPLAKELEGPDLTVVLHAARTLELMGEGARPARTALIALAARVKDAKGDLAMFVGFSTGALLEKLGR